jgi:uncharacterized membrane protein YkvA (DUF1232 family)
MALRFDRIVWEGLKNPSQALQILLNLPNLAKLIYRLFKDPRVPIHLKIILSLALIYVVSPFDLIPDFLFPVFGHIDDLIILYAACKYFLKKCPRQVLEEHVKQMETEKK